MSDPDPAFERYAPIGIGIAAGLLGLVLLVPLLASPGPQLADLVLLGLGAMAVVCLVAIAVVAIRRSVQRQKSAKALALRVDDLNLFVVASRHDLREPLRKIITFGERLRESLGSTADARQDRYAERMADAAERMQGLLDELTAHSRIHDGALVTEAFPVRTELAGVLDGLAAELEACGGQVALGELGDIRANRAQFSALCRILLGNAIQYAAKDRPLAVSVDRETGPDGTTQIRFKDNGIGFDPANNERIFAPLVRLHARDAYPGTGIGLAIARKIAHRHGGQLIAHGESGIGATFTLILPRQKASLYQDDPKSTLQPG
ncbi:sensor histidine kinase [Maricaulis sp.]|uniref:sensor histidine kinase n=1 Tax=Maricaulis sp. TaxID=1486257 RepID=UPI002B27A031|nr:ATP-binding protein [Maricaulis sp.]